MITGTIPQMTPAEFTRHLERARSEGIQVVQLSARKEDLGRVKSGHRVYEASLQGCTCKAGQAGTFCKHRALVLEMTGYADDVAPGYYEEATASSCPTCGGTGTVTVPAMDGSGTEDYDCLHCGDGKAGSGGSRGPWFAWEVMNGWTVYPVAGQVYNGAPRLNVPGGCYRTRGEAEALATRLNNRDASAFALLDSKTRRRFI